MKNNEFFAVANNGIRRAYQSPTMRVVNVNSMDLISTSGDNKDMVRDNETNGDAE